MSETQCDNAKDIHEFAESETVCKCRQRIRFLGSNPEPDSAEWWKQIAQQLSIEVRDAHESVRLIATAIGVSIHARPYSTQEFVERDILPALLAREDRTGQGWTRAQVENAAEWISGEGTPELGGYAGSELRAMLRAYADTLPAAPQPSTQKRT